MSFLNKVLSFLCITLSLIVKAQQDPIASQYHLNPSMINPAYSGLYNSFMLNANSRIQWMGLEGSPVSNFLTMNTSILAKKIGGGLIFCQDNIGITSTTELAMSYAYRIQMDQETLSFGLQGGLMNIRQNTKDLMLRYPDDPEFPQAVQATMKPNFGVGFVLMGDRYFIGVSVPKIMNVKFNDGLANLTQYKRHYYGSFAFITDVTPFLKIKPNALVRYSNGAPISYDVGASILWDHKFWAGLYTRNFTSQGALFQLIINQTVRAGYAIEIPTSKHTAVRYITHELVVGIDLSLFKHQEAFLRYF